MPFIVEFHAISLPDQLPRFYDERRPMHADDVSHLLVECDALHSDAMLLPPSTSESCLPCSSITAESYLRPDIEDLLELRASWSPLFDSSV